MTIAEGCRASSVDRISAYEWLLLTLDSRKLPSKVVSINATPTSLARDSALAQGDIVSAARAVRHRPRTHIATTRWSVGLEGGLVAWVRTGASLEDLPPLRRFFTNAAVVGPLDDDRTRGGLAARAEGTRVWGRARCKLSVLSLAQTSPYVSRAHTC